MVVNLLIILRILINWCYWRRGINFIFGEIDGKRLLLVKLVGKKLKNLIILLMDNFNLWKSGNGWILSCCIC